MNEYDDDFPICVLLMCVAGDIVILYYVCYICVLKGTDTFIASFVVRIIQEDYRVHPRQSCFKYNPFIDV